MHAVILAGGRGVRLRPYTTSLPKPLVPIGEELSILEIVLMQLADQGFERATLAIGHLGHLIRSFVGDGSRWGIKVDYVSEEMPLGTIGPVVGILDRLPEHFLVMNGDVLTDMHYGQMLAEHSEQAAPLTIATYDRTVHIDFGVLDVNGASVVGFQGEAEPGLPGQHGRVRDDPGGAAGLPRGPGLRLRRPGARPAGEAAAPGQLPLRGLLVGYWSPR